jgi:hypothetical protein
MNANIANIKRGSDPSINSAIMLRYGLLLTALAVSASAQTVALSVVQAADYRPYVAPGSLAAVFGQNLSVGTASAELNSSGQLPTQLSGTSVQICGETAGLIFVSPTQVNLFIPTDVQPGLCSIEVQTSATSVSGSVDIRSVSPGLFVLNSRLGGAAVLARRLDFSIGAISRPDLDGGDNVFGLLWNGSQECRRIRPPRLDDYRCHRANSGCDRYRLADIRVIRRPRFRIIRLGPGKRRTSP